MITKIKRQTWYYKEEQNGWRKRKIKKGRGEESLWKKKECHATWSRRYSKMSCERAATWSSHTLKIDKKNLMPFYGKSTAFVKSNWSCLLTGTLETASSKDRRAHRFKPPFFFKIHLKNLQRNRAASLRPIALQRPSQWPNHQILREN